MQQGYHTCLSCQSPFLRAGPCQQQVPHHHLIAHLVDSDDEKHERIRHLDSKQDWGQFVAVSCFAMHVHIDRDQEEQAFQVTLKGG